MFNIAFPLDLNAAARGSETAVIAGDRRLSHHDFALMVRRAAGHLKAQGIGPGQRVGLALKDTPEHLAALFALARIGAVTVPVDWRWSGPEKARMRDAFGCQAILGEADDPAASLAFGLGEPDSAPPAPPGPLIIALSSGSTGLPKGPVIGHAQMVARFMTQWVTLGLGADRFLAVTPLYFGAGRAFCLSTLVAGGTVILLPPPHRPGDIVAAANRHGATTMFLVPTLLRALLEEAGPAPAFPGLSVLILSGAALHAGEHAAARARLTGNLFNYYASTEGGGIAVLRPDDGRPDSVGRPAFLVEVEVVDDAGRRQPPGVVGSLRYRGPGVAPAPPGDPAFDGDWFRPGDLAAIDADGFVVLAGREKEVINRAGVKIHPAEVEAALLSHPAVAEAAVVAWPGGPRGEEVAGFVVLREAVPAEAVLEHLRGRLAPYKVPRALFLRDSLPKSALGKILKLALRDSLPPLDGGNPATP